jgi:hypothetical protein
MSINAIHLNCFFIELQTTVPGGVFVMDGNGLINRLGLGWGLDDVFIKDVDGLINRLA